MVEQPALLLTESAVLNTSLLLQVSQSLHFPLESFSIVTASGNASLAPIAGRTFSHVVSLADTEGFHTSSSMQSFNTLVSPGGCLFVQESSGSQVVHGHRKLLALLEACVPKLSNSWPRLCRRACAKLYC